MGSQRSSKYPNLPSLAEAGYPQVDGKVWYGISGPARIPQPVVDRLAAVTTQVMADKDFQAKLIAQAFEPIADSNPESARKYMAEEVARWTPVLKRAGMTTN